MKNLLSLSFAVLSFTFFISQAEARDLTYKFGAGWRQSYTNAVVSDDGTKSFTDKQLNGLDLTYGIAKDLYVGAFFGFTGNFDFASMGPRLRYDLHRLIQRDSAAWKYIHIFTEVSFLAKFGNKSKAGITIHAPEVGLEILPFSEINLALLTSVGLVIDFVERNRAGFTQGLLGDLGIRYYF